MGWPRPDKCICPKPSDDSFRSPTYPGIRTLSHPAKQLEGLSPVEVEEFAFDYVQNVHLPLTMRSRGYERGYTLTDIRVVLGVMLSDALLDVRPASRRVARLASPLCVNSRRGDTVTVKRVSIAIGVVAVVLGIVFAVNNEDGLMLLMIGVALTGFGVGGWSSNTD